MRSAFAVAALAALSVAVAAEPAVDGAPPALGAPPADAAPRARPLLPDGQDDPRADQDQRLQRRLAERVRGLDARLLALSAEHPGIRPRASDPPSASLEEPRRRRDASFADFRRAAQDRAARGRGATADALEAATPQAQDRVRGPIAAVNALAIAECYKDLSGAPEGEPDDLDRGARAVDAIAAEGLPEAELPRLYYLRLWFVAEAARRAPPGERAAKAEAARAAAKDLAARFPLSELARTGQALVIGLEDEPRAGGATK